MTQTTGQHILADVTRVLVMKSVYIIISQFAQVVVSHVLAIAQNYKTSPNIFAQKYCKLLRHIANRTEIFQFALVFVVCVCL